MDNIQNVEAIETKLNSLEEDAPEETSGPSQAALDAAEFEAGRKGWVNLANYKKDKDSWVDAQTFLERGDRFVANALRNMARLTQKLDEFEGTKKAFEKFSQETLAKKEEQLNEAISSLRVQRTAAIREGEDDLAVQLEDRIDLLRDQRKEVKAAPQQVEQNKTAPNNDDPVLQDWIADDNKWFDEEPKLRDFAITVGERLIKDGETVRGRRFLDKIRGIMETEFPRRFQKKDTSSTNRAGAESSSESLSRSTGGRTEKDLPKEDLALMKQFIEDGLTTKEKFLKSYFN